MKKFLLLVMMFAAAWSLQAQSNPSAAQLQSSAIDFDWNNGNEQTAADGTKWYKVDLSQVNTDENLLLYLNNLSTVEAKVTVRAAIIVGNTVQILDEATRVDQPIAPNYYYAKELGHSLFSRITAVYVELTTTQTIRMAAEPVEPGEKDMTCMNAAVFNRAGTHHATGQKWYKVELSDVIADPTKTLEITVTNLGDAATVTAGLSFDCPSTGTTDKVMYFAAGEIKKVTLKRSYIDLVGADEMVYVEVASDQPLKVTAQVVDAPVPTETYTVENPVDVTLDQLYTLAAGTPTWYRITLADVDIKRHMPEVTVENKSAVNANINGILIYAAAGTIPQNVPATATRTLSVAAGEAWVREVQRNVVEAAASKYDYAYVRLDANTQIEFIARLKQRAAGTQCLKAINFDWINGNVQTAGTTVWYAVDIADAKSATNAQKNIRVRVENKGTYEAVLAAQFATSCPCDVTQNFSRTVPAKDSMMTTIKNSTYSVLAGDTIWVGLSTDQDVHLYAYLVQSNFNDTIEECINATDFDQDIWETGVVQTADTAWYKVPLYQVKAKAADNKQVPLIKVANRGTAAANITVELAFECPVVREMERRTITIPAGDTYEKSVTANMIDGIDPNYTDAYIRVITNQEIGIQVEFKYEDAGKYCSTAEEFNWTLGVDYEADQPYWYKVNVADARDNEQDIVIRITNNNDMDVKVKAEATIECPIVSGLNEYKHVIPAHRTQEKKITYATLAGVGSDIIYIRVTAEDDLHIEAYTQGDPKPKTDICNDPSIQFVDFDWTNGHVQGAETVWYRVALDTLRGDDVPVVLVENLGHGVTTVRGEVAFKCEVKLESMMGKTITLEANGTNGDTWAKEATKSMMSMVDSTKQYAYIRVEASDSIRFNGGLVNPNQGHECYTAIDFDWDFGHEQAGGDTLWYKVRLQDVLDQANKAAVVGVKNLDSWTGDVTAEFFFTCEDSIPFETRTYPLGGNLRRELPLGRETFSSLAVEYIYIRLYTAQKDSIYARLIDVEPPVLPVVACDSAIQAQINLIIEQKAGVEQWYYIDIADIRANTEGDAFLEVWNGDQANTMSASLSWACQPTEKMISKKRPFVANETFTHTVLRSVINNVNKDMAWIFVTTEQDMKFRVTLKDHRGENCSNPIEYDWINGNTHPAGDTLWYKVRLDTMQTAYGLTKDLRLTVKNLAENAAASEAIIYLGCNGVTDSLGSIARLLPVNDTLRKDIRHAVIDSIIGDSLLIRLTAAENVYLHAELIGVIDPIDSTVVDTICAGTIYYGKDSTEHLIAAGAIATWTDSVAFKYKDADKTVYGPDTIFHYQIHPMTNPVAVDVDTLNVTLYMGRAINYKALTDSLLAIYLSQAADTVAKLDSATLKWETFDADNNAWVAADNNKLGFDKESIRLRYSIQSECGDTIGIYAGTVIELDSTYIHRDTIDSIVCAGSDITIRGQVYNIVSDSTIIDNYIVVDWDATLKQDVDSITTYNFSIWKAPVLNIPTSLPVAKVGKAVDVTAATTEIKTDINNQVTADNKIASLEDSVYWQKKSGDTYVALTNDFVTSADSITLRYGIHADVCDTFYYSADIQIAVAPKDSFERVINDTVCYNTIYPTHENAAGYTITADVTYRERFAYAASADQEIDSVYIYNIYVYKEYTAENLTAIEAQVGKVISTAAAETELKQKLDAQNTADPLKVTYSTIDWAVKTGTYTMGENLTSDAALTFQYTVNTNEGCSNLTGDVVVNIAAADSVVYNVAPDTLCAGETYNSRLVAGKVINATETWSERVALADKTDAAQWKDSVYVYNVYVYEAATKKAVTTKPTVSCGKPVDVTAATAALETAFAPAGLEAPIDTIAWEIDLGAGWTALTDDALDTRIESVQMRYNATTICGDIVTGDAITVTVAEDCVEEIAEITDTVCAGSEYKTRLQTVTVNAFTEVSDTVMCTDVTTGNKFDSIYNYTIYIYKELVLPEQEDITSQPVAICGEEVDVTATITELETSFTTDALTEPIEEITWEIDLGNGYEPLADQGLAADVKSIKLRYTVKGLCNTKQGEFTINVEKPNSVNSPNTYEEQEIVEKYNGWLLMVNYIKLKAKADELGVELTEQSVVWYKVNGEPDITTQDPNDLPDDSVGVGYYYTQREILDAGDEYYASIALPVESSDDCGGSMYTNFIVIKKGAAPLNMTPNIVKPGEEMYITGLDGETEYIVTVYDLTGVCLEKYSVDNAESYVLRAQEAQGYYMVQVDADGVHSETFKYVVK